MEKETKTINWEQDFWKEASRLLRPWVRIPPGAWIFVCCECCVLSGRGLCDGLITRPEESCRLRCVVVCDLETSRMRRPWHVLGHSATKRKIVSYNIISYHIISYHIISYIITHHIIQYHILYHIIPYHIISHHIITHIIQYHILHHIPYHITSYHNMSYHILYHTISYHITSYHIISYHIIS